MSEYLPSGLPNQQDYGIRGPGQKTYLEQHQSDCILGLVATLLDRPKQVQQDLKRCCWDLSITEPVLPRPSRSSIDKSILSCRPTSRLQGLVLKRPPCFVEGHAQTESVSNSGHALLGQVAKRRLSSFLTTLFDGRSSGRTAGASISRTRAESTRTRDSDKTS